MTDVWSFGGGTQSVAIAVLIAQGRLPKPERTIFADTSRKFNAVYLHDSRVPLKDADISEKPKPESWLFNEVEGCDTGYCWA